jgi:DNA ligase-1
MLSEKLQGFKDPTVWPQLYAKASTGKIKTWQIGVTLNDDNTATIWTLHGYVDGKLQLKPKPIKIGKNIGKKNETTPYDQAVSEAFSSHKKKIDKKYITEIPTSDNEPDIYLPMLAKKLQESYVKFPVMCQPKLNGVRCLSKKFDELTINYTSRKFKSYNETLGHLTADLLEMMRVNEIFDGEIYYYGFTFQQIIRRVKKLREDSNMLQYWVYDVADETMEASVRNSLYQARIPDDHPRIIKVPTSIALTMDDIQMLHNQNVGLGFEGTIIRNMDGKYKFDFRSADLLKKKDFKDKEFKIVGGKAEVVAEYNEETGETTEQHAVVFECQMDDDSGNTFEVRPRGSVELRVKWLNELENIKGKDLTVRYQERSEDNVPIFPVGIVIRDYE